MRTRSMNRGGDGFSFFEVLCAIAVVSIVSLGVVGSLVSTLAIDRDATTGFRVENVAAATMEEYLAKPFHSLTIGVTGPVAVDGCQVTARVYQIAAGNLTVPPRYGIEINVRDSQNAQIRATLVSQRTDRSY